MDYPSKMNAAYFLVDKNANERPEAVSIYYEDQSITYGELLVKVNVFGNALKELGIKKGDRFVCRMPNRPEAAVIFLAGLKIGAVVVPSFPFLGEKEIEYIINITDSVGIVSNSESLNEIKDIQETCSTVKWIVSVGEHDSANYNYYELIKSCSPLLDPIDTSKDDLAVLCFTSGTTGKPKGLPHRHVGLVMAGDASVPLGLDGLEEGDVLFTTSPFGFSFGLCALVYFPFRFGASTVYSDRKMDAEKVFEILEGYRVTHFFTVPTMCQKMLSVPNANQRYDISRLRLVKVGAMPTSIELQKEWKATFGVDVLPAFGMQELVGSAISSFPRRFKYGSLGLPLPGCEVRVLDENGESMPPGKEGRLAIKAPFAIKYYWKDPEKTQKYFPEQGWLYTDDIVYQDDEGYYYYVGRSDDMIISAGWTISPTEIEEVIKSHVAVADVAAFDMPDPEKGKIPVAAIVLKEGIEASSDLTEDLNHVLKKKLAPYKCPREIYYVESLPKTITGKVLRNRLRLEADSYKKV